MHSHQDQTALTLDPLEPRILFSHHHAAVPADVAWVPYAQLTNQSTAVYHYPAVTGSGIRIAVIDRGIDYLHPQLGGGIGKHFTVIGGANLRDKSGVLLDDYGHGTGVAGILAASGFMFNGQYDQGVAPQAQLLDLKQESSQGVKAALDWVIKNAVALNIQVVNLTDFVTDVGAGGYDPMLYQSELKTIHDMGIFISTPVGNGNGPNFVDAETLPIGYPALSPYVFGAGGFDQSGGLWFGSRRGTGLDALGPAENVTIPYYLQNKATPGFDQYDDQYNGTATIVNYAKGTSWASAYMSGTAALIKQINAKITPDQIAKVIRDTGTVVVDPATGLKYARLNIDAAIGLAWKLYGKKTKASAARAVKAAVRPAVVFSAQPIGATTDNNVLTGSVRNRVWNT